ncbi:probable receptor-like protein kinase At5g20050 [Typha latifolia]|uniref:probable receptor-like protein kinase At5g20050 n=1 Tax=Typha latifolia TaxID=4733 RepID=UPI003C2C9224
MDPKKARIIAAASTTTLLIQLIVLFLSLGATKTFVAIAAVDVALIVAIFIWILSLYAGVDRRRLSMVRRSAIEGEQFRVEYSFLRKVANVPTKFRYEVLAAATDDFKALIGRGSSASVFKGILDDGTAVAVKQINSELHGEREFRAEVTAVASIHHVNLIRLLGYCVLPNGGPRYLVYEFIENGSLDAWIFPRKDPRAAGESGTRCLPWHLRRRVAVDVAKALAYLHHGCRHRVLHLDIKPENILLDECFRAVVADFGLSKLMGRDESRVLTTVRGTRGYLAPEWLIETGISEKSDIYSYGMVLLELVSGRRNVQMSATRKWSYFPKIATEMVKLGRITEVVDERLFNNGGGVDEMEARNLVYVALWCIQEKAKSRPSMERVVDMLEGRMAVDLPPEPDMVILDLLGNENVEVNARDGAATRLLQLDTNEITSSSTGTFDVSILSGR